MPRLRVATLDSLPPGEVMEFQAGDAVFALCNIDGAIACLDGVCPHAGGPLGQGALHGSVLVCPWHGWEFDCRSGISKEDEDLQLQTFPVIVENGEILIEVP